MVGTARLTDFKTADEKVRTLPAGTGDPAARTPGIRPVLSSGK
jgi:hypothetical protein